ncbi:MAG: hypothetical protein KH230_13620 [Enterocloster asparagiformis]|nr:hypothetical protein [Enterocloster asparagiformis]
MKNWVEDFLKNVDSDETVILCSKEEYANDLLKELKKIDFIWNSSESLSEITNWYWHENDTCYFIEKSKKIITYGSKDYAEQNYYKIFNYEDIYNKYYPQISIEKIWEVCRKFYCGGYVSDDLMTTFGSVNRRDIEATNNIKDIVYKLINYDNNRRDYCAGALVRYLEDNEPYIVVSADLRTGKLNIMSSKCGLLVTVDEVEPLDDEAISEIDTILEKLSLYKTKNTKVEENI